MTTPIETAWLIEREDLKGGLHYFAKHDNGHWWTPDPNKAERFADEELATMCCQGGNKDGPLKVREHKWILR
jgi:hypothetical protein